MATHSEASLLDWQYVSRLLSSDQTTRLNNRRLDARDGKSRTPCGIGVAIAPSIATSRQRALIGG